MYGVRKLLAGASGSGSNSAGSSSAAAAALTSSPPQEVSLNFTQKNGPNWPPPSPGMVPPGEPMTTGPYPLSSSGSRQSTPNTRQAYATPSPTRSQTLPNSPASASVSASGRSSSPGRRPLSSRKSVASPTSTATSTSNSNANLNRLSASAGPLNTRDELLISLMASEAVIDCREFEILGAEEVEELKKEHQVLSSRHTALHKKLSLETKIRDAALSLSRVNASHGKAIAKQTSEQLDAANARVDKAQTELWRVAERLNEVQRRLMEHRAGVLSFSVRNMERKMNGSSGTSNGGTSEDSGYDSSNRSTLLSPTLTPLNGLASPTAKTPFDGHHFFAGHAETIVPKPKLSPEAAAAKIALLEGKLKEAKDALASAGKKQAELSRELAMMRLEKQEVETLMEVEVQAARETIAGLEEGRGREEEEREEQLKAMEEEVSALRREREEWEMDKEDWERERDDLLREKEDAQVDAEELRRKLEDVERRRGETEQGVQRQLEDRDREIQDLRREMDDMRLRWEEERRVLEDEKLEDLARLQEEMDAARKEAASASSAELLERLTEQERLQQETREELEAGLASLQTLVQTHSIVLSSRDRDSDTSLQALLAALSTHLASVHTRLEAYARSEAEWEVVRRRLEEEVRSGVERREEMARELEEVRRERDVVRREAESSRARSQSQSQLRTPGSTYSNLPPSTTAEGDTEHSPDAARIISILQPLWAILPSPEARAAKFSNTRSFRTGSPTPGTPGGSNPSSTSGVVASLSDLDVRSLKALYTETRTPASPKPGAAANAAPFTVEAFAQRVQALMADDRALIERLVRFAQAHDLLKKNAERAQKLAQEGTHALETYQKQVRMLEERNTSLAQKQLALQEELQLLHDTIERLTAEKRDLEALAAEQAETCRQLTEANNTLSARALTLAEEAAQAPEMVRKQLEAQIGELKRSLGEAREEVDAMRGSEQSQRIALLDELNEMQKENGELRSQLRALKK
ncbi:hypothetical protein CVT26_004272 [Gymnopilus dilepis]|uniref:Up-regulated during septation protein 1 domain-containing protein n=1 Tax=Gymnopilus dilepis TaxID=231916 RepID=A0A409WPS3_9AGAR|nr:hypothetical protein CVT26_004272 [Gymnopilus dilepis]